MEWMLLKNLGKTKLRMLGEDKVEEELSIARVQAQVAATLGYSFIFIGQEV